MKFEINPNYKHVKPLLENIEEYFEQADKVLHDGRNKIYVISFDGVQYVIKAFKVPNLINRFAYRYLRPSKAKRSFDYSLKLGAELCPEAVAYIEEHHNGLLGKSYYISSFFDYDVEIRALQHDKSFNHRTQILEEFAVFTFQLHEKGILHQDYSPGNILIKKEGEHYQFKIIDVNRMVFKTLSLEERLSNFVRLSVDDETMQTILFKYAECIQQDPLQIFNKAKAFSVAYENKRALKNKMRGRN